MTRPSNALVPAVVLAALIVAVGPPAGADPGGSLGGGHVGDCSGYCDGDAGGSGNSGGGGASGGSSGGGGSGGSGGSGSSGGCTDCVGSGQSTDRRYYTYVRGAAADAASISIRSDSHLDNGRGPNIPYGSQSLYGFGGCAAAAPADPYTGGRIPARSVTYSAEWELDTGLGNGERLVSNSDRGTYRCSWSYTYQVDRCPWSWNHDGFVAEGPFFNPDPGRYPPRTIAHDERASAFQTYMRSPGPHNDRDRCRAADTYLGRAAFAAFGEYRLHLDGYLANCTWRQPLGAGGGAAGYVGCDTTRLVHDIALDAYFQLTCAGARQVTRPGLPADYIANACEGGGGGGSTWTCGTLTLDAPPIAFNDGKPVTVGTRQNPTARGVSGVRWIGSQIDVDPDSTPYRAGVRQDNPTQPFKATPSAGQATGPRRTFDVAFAEGSRARGNPWTATITHTLTMTMRTDRITVTGWDSRTGAVLFARTTTTTTGVGTCSARLSLRVQTSRQTQS